MSAALFIEPNNARFVAYIVPRARRDGLLRVFITGVILIGR